MSQTQFATQCSGSPVPTVPIATGEVDIRDGVVTPSVKCIPTRGKVFFVHAFNIKHPISSAELSKSTVATDRLMVLLLTVHMYETFGIGFHVWKERVLARPKLTQDVDDNFSRGFKVAVKIIREAQNKIANRASDLRLPDQSSVDATVRKDALLYMQIAEPEYIVAGTRFWLFGCERDCPRQAMIMRMIRRFNFVARNKEDCVRRRGMESVYYPHIEKFYQQMKTQQQVLRKLQRLSHDMSLNIYTDRRESYYAAKEGDVGLSTEFVSDPRDVIKCGSDFEDPKYIVLESQLRPENYGSMFASADYESGKFERDEQAASAAGIVSAIDSSDDEDAAGDDGQLGSATRLPPKPKQSREREDMLVDQYSDFGPLMSDWVDRAPYNGDIILHLPKNWICPDPLQTHTPHGLLMTLTSHALDTFQIMGLALGMTEGINVPAWGLSAVTDFSRVVLDMGDGLRADAQGSSESGTDEPDATSDTPPPRVSNARVDLALDICSDPHSHDRESYREQTNWSVDNAGDGSYQISDFVKAVSLHNNIILNQVVLQNDHFFNEWEMTGLADAVRRGLNYEQIWRVYMLRDSGDHSPGWAARLAFNEQACGKMNPRDYVNDKILSPPLLAHDPSLRPGTQVDITQHLFHHEKILGVVSDHMKADMDFKVMTAISRPLASSDTKPCLSIMNAGKFGGGKSFGLELMQQKSMKQVRSDRPPIVCNVGHQTACATTSTNFNNIMVCHDDENRTAHGGGGKRSSSAQEGAAAKQRQETATDRLMIWECGSANPNGPFIRSFKCTAVRTVAAYYINTNENDLEDDAWVDRCMVFQKHSNQRRADNRTVKTANRQAKGESNVSDLKDKVFRDYYQALHEMVVIALSLKEMGIISMNEDMAGLLWKHVHADMEKELGIRMTNRDCIRFRSLFDVYAIHVIITTSIFCPEIRNRLFTDSDWEGFRDIDDVVRHAMAYSGDIALDCVASVVQALLPSVVAAEKQCVVVYMLAMLKGYNESISVSRTKIIYEREDNYPLSYNGRRSTALGGGGSVFTGLEATESVLGMGFGDEEVEDATADDERGAARDWDWVVLGKREQLISRLINLTGMERMPIATILRELEGDDIEYKPRRGAYFTDPRTSDELRSVTTRRSKCARDEPGTTRKGTPPESWRSLYQMNVHALWRAHDAYLQVNQPTMARGSNLAQATLGHHLPKTISECEPQRILCESVNALIMPYYSNDYPPNLRISTGYPMSMHPHLPRVQNIHVETKKPIVLSTAQCMTTADLVRTGIKGVVGNDNADGHESEYNGEFEYPFMVASVANRKKNGVWPHPKSGRRDKPKRYYTEVERDGNEDTDAEYLRRKANRKDVIVPLNNPCDGFYVAHAHSIDALAKPEIQGLYPDIYLWHNQSATKQNDLKTRWLQDGPTRMAVKPHFRIALYNVNQHGKREFDILEASSSKTWESKKRRR